MTWQVLRAIVEELDVSEHIDLLTENFPRFDEAWEALKWVLSRNPEPKGSAVKVGTDGRRYRAFVLAGDPMAGTPNIWVVYTHDDQRVLILGVQASALSTEEEADD